MSKEIIKSYCKLGSKDRLKQIAKELGFEGRGATSRVIEKFIWDNPVFIDKNVKRLLEAINFKPKGSNSVPKE